jgi:ELWxxDGT repeat protein
MDVASIGAVNFFAASDSQHGVELWRSDGTDSGTYMLADIWPGQPASYPRNFVAAYGEVFFIADDGVHGSELWCTDGTPEGTRLVSDINPGAGSSSPQQLTIYNGYLYFLASNGGGPPALWQSDGTADGTILVSNLGGSAPLQVSVINARLQILTTDTTVGYQTWISDGTAAGTLPASSPLLVSATVSWSPVTLTTSGTPLTNLGGYKIYFGASPMALTSIIDVPDPTVSSYVVPYLTPGTLYFAVTAYISGGPESDLSTVVGAALN